MKLTDAVVKRLPSPPSANKIFYDEDVPGFGVRITRAGARSFVLNYVTKAGRERRFTIGRFPDWGTATARAEAKELRKRVDRGEDPMGDVEASREAPTVSDLCQRFLAEHTSKKRPRTQVEHRDMIANFVLPAIGTKKVAEIAFTDIDALHRKITARGTPTRANRTLSLMHKIFALAVRWRMRPDNPATGVERNEERRRNRYLSGEELGQTNGSIAGAPRPAGGQYHPLAALNRRAPWRGSLCPLGPVRPRVRRLDETWCDHKAKDRAPRPAIGCSSAVDR